MICRIRSVLKSGRLMLLISTASALRLLVSVMVTVLDLRLLIRGQDVKLLIITVKVFRYKPGMALGIPGG